MASARGGPSPALIRDLKDHVDQEVALKGWLYNRRSSGKIHFLIVRDGTGFVQAVAARGDLSDDDFEVAGSLPQESALWVTGRVKEDRRAPGGYEIGLTSVAGISEAQQDYPLALKEHGVDFLLDHRHLWLRTPRQVALMRIRSTVERALEEFLERDGFVRIDTPILTPAACEGTTTLFETDYFGEEAYLAQSGQLYAEAAAMALGKVYCFGPTFRAEKSKTRRHLIEFWMLEPEVAFLEHQGNMELQERLVSYVVQEVLARNERDLEELDRDPEPLLKVKPPFPRITYDEALEIIGEKGEAPEWGQDLGAPEERAVSESFDLPVFVEKFPATCKAFYMEPDPDRPEVALCDDLLAPEGYGEIVGGSQRIHDLELLERRLDEHGLPREAFEWYLDLRRYGTVPHSGFGIGIERTMAWIAGVEHIRECIPFPRLLNRMYP